MILYFEVARKCSVIRIKGSVYRRRIATSKYNANTSDLSGSLIITIGKTLFEVRLLSKGQKFL